MSNKIINHFKKSDPILYEVLLKVDTDKLFDLPKSNNLFKDLCESIVSQQLSVKAGETIFGRFLDLMPEKKLSPENVLSIPDELIRGAGLSGPKVKYIKDLAAKIVSKEIDLNELNYLSDEEVIVQMTRVKGIGTWTAQMFLMFALGREDVFSHGDLGLRNGIKRIYELDEYDEKIVEQIIAKWSPYRTFGARIVWKSLKLS